MNLVLDGSSAKVQGVKRRPRCPDPQEPQCFFRKVLAAALDVYTPPRAGDEPQVQLWVPGGWTVPNTELGSGHQADQCAGQLPMAQECERDLPVTWQVRHPGETFIL